MTLLEAELAKLNVDSLDKLTRSELPELAAAAQAELESRPEARAMLELRRAVFPPRPAR